MENISPALVLVWDILRATEAGLSVSSGASHFLQRGGRCELSHCLRLSLRGDLKAASDFSTHLSAPRRHLIRLIGAGLSGESIYEELRRIEVELIQGCEDEISQHLTLLPFKMMIPLLGLILPAMMIVLISPLIKLLQL